MQSDMYALLDQFSGVNPSGTYFPNPLSAAKGEKAVNSGRDKEVVESSEEMLKDMREEYKGQVEEVLQGEGGEESQEASTEPDAETPTACLDQICLNCKNSQNLWNNPRLTALRI